MGWKTNTINPKVLPFQKDSPVSAQVGDFAENLIPGQAWACEVYFFK